MKDFGNKIKELRIKENISQLELAQDFKVSQNTIHKWETGKTEPDQITLIKLANYFNVSIEYLFDLEPRNATQHVANEAIEVISKLDIKPDKINNLTNEQLEFAKQLLKTIQEQNKT